jgi:hypothetical protein
MKFMIDFDQIRREANELGADATAVIRTEDIEFVADFRTACEKNTCGQYGLNWMCPRVCKELFYFVIYTKHFDLFYV